MSFFFHRKRAQSELWRALASSRGLSGPLTGGPGRGAEPVRTILSGPAGGVVGAAERARRAGHPRGITLDMGGTSADVSLVDGALAYRSETSVDGLPVRLPPIELPPGGPGGGAAAALHRG